MASVIRDINLLDDRLKQIVWDVHKDIIAFHNLPIKVFETLRSVERQKECVANHTSKTMYSRHLANAQGKSEAVDFVVYIDGKWSWENKHLHYYEFFGQLVKAKYDKIILWGKDFKTWDDYPHFELRK